MPRGFSGWHERRGCGGKLPASVAVAAQDKPNILCGISASAESRREDLDTEGTSFIIRENSWPSVSGRRLLCERKCDVYHWIVEAADQGRPTRQQVDVIEPRNAGGHADAVQTAVLHTKVDAYKGCVRPA